mgnify:CR=1 FL=1
MAMQIGDHGLATVEDDGRLYLQRLEDKRVGLDAEKMLCFGLMAHAAFFEDAPEWNLLQQDLLLRRLGKLAEENLVCAKLDGLFVVIEAQDLDEALELAARHPDAEWGSVEVRPVMVFKEAP